MPEISLSAKKGKNIVRASLKGTSRSTLRKFLRILTNYDARKSSLKMKSFLRKFLEYDFQICMIHSTLSSICECLMMHFNCLFMFLQEHYKNLSQKNREGGILQDLIIFLYLIFQLWWRPCMYCLLAISLFPNMCASTLKNAMLSVWSSRGSN